MIYTKNDKLTNIKIKKNNIDIIANTQSINQLIEQTLFPIKTIILTEAVSAIIINTDDNGNAFSLSEIEIIILCGANSLIDNNVTTNSINAQFNDITDPNYTVLTSPYIGFTSFYVTQLRNVLSEVYKKYKIVPGALVNIISSGMSLGYTTPPTISSSNNNTIGILSDSQIDSINKIYLFSTVALPIGTLIEIRGVRK